MSPAAVVLLVGVVALSACGSEVRDDSASGGGSASGQGGAGTSSTATGTGATSTSSTSASSTSSSSTSTGNGGGPSFAACGAAGTCVLALQDCCGPCGDPAITDYDAVNRDAEDAHFAAVCPDPAGTPCPGCAVDPDPNLFAYCDLDGGRCVGADLPRTELASCETWEDCTLRAGVGCCEPCEAADPWAWVALRADAVDDLEALVCEPGTGCPECGPPTPPAELFAECLDGVCNVVLLEGPPP